MQMMQTSTLYILYEQLKLDDSYRTYLGCIRILNNALRTGIQPTPYQKAMKWFAGVSLEQ